MLHFYDNLVAEQIHSILTDSHVFLLRSSLPKVVTHTYLLYEQEVHFQICLKLREQADFIFCTINSFMGMDNCTLLSKRIMTKDEIEKLMHTYIINFDMLC